MLIGWHLRYDYAAWGTWLALGVGLVVAFLVYVVLTQLRKWRRLAAFANGDLPWEDLLEMLQARPPSKRTGDPELKTSKSGP